MLEIEDDYIFPNYKYGNKQNHLTKKRKLKNK